MAAATSLNIIDDHRMDDTGHGNGLTTTAGSVRVWHRGHPGGQWPPLRAWKEIDNLRTNDTGHGSSLTTTAGMVRV